MRTDSVRERERERERESEKNTHKEMHQATFATELFCVKIGNDNSGATEYARTCICMRTTQTDAIRPSVQFGERLQRTQKKMNNGATPEKRSTQNQLTRPSHAGPFRFTSCH